MVAFVSLKREAIQRAVRDMYAAVASEPQRRFHFPTGRVACEQLGYPREWLDALPERALESFAGVGYPFAADAVREGDRVLDIGSGSGTVCSTSALARAPRRAQMSASAHRHQNVCTTMWRLYGPRSK